MRKIALALAATIAMTSVAHADWNHHRHGMGGFGGVPPQHHYHGGGGGDPGAALFGGLVGGLIIGGMINQMNQPRPYYGGPQYYQDQPYCQQIVTNRFWNGWRWVYQVQTVCD
jgi:hypothetical protein